MRETLLENVERLIDPLLKESDLILVDLRVHATVRGVMIQILTDHPQGGVTLLECSQLNRRISLAIDQENLITERYTLEVSSPGLDRPLKSPQDFLRVAGRPVKFFLSEPLGGKWEHQGIVRQVTDEVVLIEAEITRLAIPFNQINKAQQIIGKVRHRGVFPIGPHPERSPETESRGEVEGSRDPSTRPSGSLRVSPDIKNSPRAQERCSYGQ